MPCPTDKGYKIDETGHCVCALERGMIIDERGNCICPIDHKLTSRGECIIIIKPECETDDQCADNRYCNRESKTCEDPCTASTCGVNAFCSQANHIASCTCITGYVGDPLVYCSKYSFYLNIY